MRCFLLKAFISVGYLQQEAKYMYGVKTVLVAISFTQTAQVAQSNASEV